MNSTFTSSKYIPWLLGIGFLLAYSWASPFRDLYGIEARNALMAKEMLNRGFSFVPSVMGRPYPDYPPLYFWFVSLLSKFGGKISTLGTILPSALCAAGLIVITFALGSYRSFRTGIISGFVLGTFPEFWFKASKATIDMMLAFEVGLGLFFLWQTRGDKASRVRKTMASLAASLAVLAALLTKGPVGMVLIGGIWGLYLLLCKDFRGFVVFTGLYMLLAACCSGIYVLLVWHEGGASLVKEVLNSQVLGRLGGTPNKSIIYYERYIVEATAPWWLWVVAFVVKWKNDGKAKKGKWQTFKIALHEPLLKLALAWAFVVLLIFSVASSRHGRYLLPAFPAFAIIISLFIEGILDRNESGAGSRGAEKVIGIFFFMFLVVAWILYIVVNLLGRVDLMWLFIWSTGLLVFWFEKDKIIPVPSRVFSAQIVCMVVILSGMNLLAYPIISQRESGKGFVEEVEAKVPSKVPIVLFKIKQDGDGVKYALYSTRSSSSLNFVSSIERLGALPKPYVLVIYKKNVRMLLKNSNGEIVPIARGLIHHKPVAAYLLEEANIS